MNSTTAPSIITLPRTKLGRKPHGPLFRIGQVVGILRVRERIETRDGWGNRRISYRVECVCGAITKPPQSELIKLEAGKRVHACSTCEQRAAEIVLGETLIAGMRITAITFDAERGEHTRRYKIQGVCPCGKTRNGYLYDLRQMEARGETFSCKSCKPKSFTEKRVTFAKLVGEELEIAMAAVRRYVLACRRGGMEPFEDTTLDLVAAEALAIAKCGDTGEDWTAETRREGMLDRRDFTRMLRPAEDVGA